MVILSVLLLPAMVIRFYQGWFQMLYIDVPPIPGLDVFDFKLLSCFAARTVSEDLAEGLPLFAIFDGIRNPGLHCNEYLRRDRSAYRKTNCVRAYP